MAFEVELKVRLHQPDKVQQRVTALGLFVDKFYKEDVYFKRCDEPDPLPALRYRLRREADRSVVTFKYHLSEGDEIEINHEIEFEVSNAHAFFRFTDRFGFEPFVVKRKRGLVYRIGRAHVELNNVEYAGHFAEIEILCTDPADVPAARAELTSLLTTLDLPLDDLEPRRYIELIYEAHPVRYRFVDNPALDWPFEEAK